MRSLLCTGNCKAGLQDCRIRPDMVVNMLEQCLHETETHIRTLEYLTTENISLKKRLTTLLQRSINRDFLEKAEFFHHQFIMEDEAVKIMRHDVTLQEKALQVSAVYTDEVMNRLQTMQIRLRREMEGIETGFNKLKFDFYHCVGEFLGLASVQVPE